VLDRGAVGLAVVAELPVAYACAAGVNREP
jgi:hypothetical protein